MAEDSLQSRFKLICDKSPHEGLKQLDAFLSSVAPGDLVTRAELFRLASFAARLANEMVSAADLSLQALTVAEASTDTASRVTAGMTHAYNLFLLGENDEALDLIASLDGGGDQQLTARILFQEATILARTGRVGEAAVRFAEANKMAEVIDDLLLSAMISKNLGLLSVQAGDHGEARDHFLKALDRFQQLGNIQEVHSSTVALGTAALKTGDLPEAFRYLNEGEAGLASLAGDDFELKRSRCEALIVAGLFSEAAETAEEAAQRCLEAGLAADGAEIEHMAAAAWLDAGDFDAARESAERARQALLRSRIVRRGRRQRGCSPWRLTTIAASGRAPTRLRPRSPRPK